MAGWPWPLDAVQTWFDGLWNWVFQVNKGTEVSSSGWIGGFTGWLRTQVDAFGQWIVDSLVASIDFAGKLIHGIRVTLETDVLPALSTLGTEVAALAQTIIDAVTSGLEDGVSRLNKAAADLGASMAGLIDQAGKALEGVGSWLVGTLWGWVDGALRWASDTFLWLQREISNTGAYVVDQVSTAFDGALSAVGDTIGSIFGPSLGQFTGFLSTFTDLRSAAEIDVHLGDVRALQANLAAEDEAFRATHSPMTPTEAFELTSKWRNRQRDYWYQMYLTALFIETGSLGQVEGPTTMLFKEPQVAASFALAEAWYAAPYKYGIEPRLQQFWLQAYQPMIPPAVDLIRFVVREVVPPETFYEYMPLQGFNAEIAKWYWEAHWILPPITQLYDAYHRKVINLEELDKYVVLHDFKPEPRPGISKSDQEIVRSVIKTLIPRVDLRYAWEIGMLSDEELTDRYETLGYEEDSELMAKIQIARTLTEEIGKLRTEWTYEFTDGYIDEDTLRANMAAVGIIGMRQDYYVEYAYKRRERQRRKDLLDLYRDGFMKDMITDEDLRDRVLELLVVPEVADLFVEKAYVDKYKRPLPPRETEEEKALKELQKYQVTYAIQAYRKFAVEKPELVEMLVEAGVDPAVAETRADYEELKRPVPKPSAATVAAEKEAARIQTLEVNRAMEEFRRYAIDEDTLLNRLVEAGLTEELATARMQLESIRRPPPAVPPEEIERQRVAAEVQRLTGLALEAQYRRYALEKADLIAGLVAAGLDPAEAAARADYEEARRPTPKPTAEERAAEKEEALIQGVQERIAKLEYRKYLIEAEELSKRLISLDYSEEAADAMARLEELTRPLPKPSEEEIQVAKEALRTSRLSESTAEAEYVKGLISEDEFRDRLEGIGYGAPLIDAIVAGAQVRAFKPTPLPPAPVVREAPVSTLLRAFRLDLVTAEDLLAELMRRGYSEESARLMVDVEAAKKG